VLTHEEAPAAHVEAIRSSAGSRSPFRLVCVATAVQARRFRVVIRVRRSGQCQSSNPYGIEGYKTIAFELFEAARARRVGECAQSSCRSAAVTVCMASTRALKSWSRSAPLARLPRVHACQPSGAAPLCGRSNQRTDEVPHVEVDRSLALSIREADTGRHALRGLRESGGRAVAVSDTEIMEAAGRLGGLGLSVDPASAASVAGRVLRWRDHVMTDDGPIVCNPDGVRSPLAAAARLAPERRAACGNVGRPGVWSRWQRSVVRRTEAVEHLNVPGEPPPPDLITSRTAPRSPMRTEGSPSTAIRSASRPTASVPTRASSPKCAGGRAGC